MTDEEIKIQITNHLSGQCTPEESRQLLKLMSEDKGVEKTYKELSKVWAASSLGYFKEKEDESLHSLHVRMAANEKPRRSQHKHLWIAAVAASLLLLLAGNVYLWFSKNSMMQELADSRTPYVISAPATSRTMVTLPDGTNVVLNADSQLSYLRNYGSEERCVTLAGEAIFDVAKDTERPFQVNAGEVKARVLGTKFDITAYPEEDDITVSLFRGKVKLCTNTGSTLTLLPNEQAQFNRKTGALKQSTFTNGDIPQWENGDLKFNQMPFSHIARMLEHRFNVSIRVLDSRLSNERFAGSFSQKEGLNDILNDINMEGLYQWSIEDNVVTIWRKQSRN